MSSSQSLSSNFDNQTIQKRVINDRDVNLFENNDQQVILVRNNSSSPIVRPGLTNGFSSHPRVNRPAGASGLKPVRANPVQGFSTPRGLITGQPVTGAHRQPTRLEGAGNPAGAGGGASSDDQCPVPENQKSQESKTFDYDYRSNSPKKKKKSQDECSIDEQNKAGIDELPDSSDYIYNLETKTARKALKTVWKNTEAKKEVLAGLDRMNKGELLPRNQKNFKGFKTLKELKFTKTRMLVQPGINGSPDQIVAIFMRRDMDNIASNFKGKYK